MNNLEDSKHLENEKRRFWRDRKIQLTTCQNIPLKIFLRLIWVKKTFGQNHPQQDLKTSYSYWVLF